MKHILFAFLLLPVLLFAQYPNSPNKSRLGYQTTGDGLIWRGVAADTSYKPIGFNMPYFQLDTVNGILRRYIRTKGKWQTVAVNPDLTPYLLKSDTAAMLANYPSTVGYGILKSAKTIRADTTKLATRYYTGSNFFPLQGGTLTGTGGAGFIGLPSQVTAAGTPASGLNIYAQGSSFNWKGTDGYERFFASTLTGGRTYTLPDVSGTFALGTGTTNRIPIWTATNTLGSSNALYNSSTKRWTWDSPSVLELPMGSDAQRPTATTSDFWYNTTGNGIEWYNGTRWAKGLESTANRFTTGSVIFADANGQAAQNNAALNWNNTSNTLNIATALSTSVNFLKLQGGINPFANTLFNITGFQSTISGHLFKIASTQGTSPYINLINELVEVGWGTTTSANKMNVLSGLNVTGKFGFAFVSNTSRTHEVLQHTSFLGGYDRGVDITTYDHRTDLTPGGFNKGDILLRLSPSKEVWVGDNTVNTNYNFSVNQPGLGYGAITTVSGSAVVNGLGGTTFFTKDFNIGSTLTINGNSYTVASIASDIQMTLTATVPTSNTYAYTITGNTERLSVYKKGGVLIKGAIGQTTNSLDVQNSSAASLFSVTPASKVSILKSGDSTLFNSTGRILGGVASLIMKTDDGGGYMAYREFSDFGYQYNYIYTNGFNDECRLYLGNARGTYTSPTSLLKNDRIGGIYFHARGNGQFNKTAVIRAEVDSIYSGDKPMAKILFGVDENNNAEASSNWRFIIKNERNINLLDAITAQNQGVGLTEFETILARLHVKGVGTTTGKTLLVEDSGGADILTVTDNKTIQAHGYGTGTKEAADISKTQSNYIAGFATDGTVLDVPINTELYNTITSTTSPQTLSSSRADNLINQGGTQATFTFRLPASPVDGQVTKATFANAVTALTIDGNGTTVTGTLPTTANIGQQIVFKNYSGLGWVRQL